MALLLKEEIFIEAESNLDYIDLAALEAIKLIASKPAEGRFTKDGLIYTKISRTEILSAAPLLPKSSSAIAGRIKNLIDHHYLKRMETSSGEQSKYIAPTPKAFGDYKYSYTEKKVVTTKQTEIETFPSWLDFLNVGLPATGKKEGERKWKKMSQKSRENAFEHAKEYVKSSSEKQYLKGVGRYLKEEKWRDEIVDRAKKVNEIVKKGRNIAEQSDAILANIGD